MNNDFKYNIKNDFYELDSNLELNEQIDILIRDKLISDDIEKLFMNENKRLKNQLKELKKEKKYLYDGIYEMCDNGFTFIPYKKKEIKKK